MRLKLILLLLLTPLAKGQQMSHEEAVVRTTYAKLSYADEVRIVMKTMNALPDKFQADERVADKALGSRLEFQLSDFKTGPVSEIEGRILSEISGSRLTATRGCFWLCQEHLTTRTIPPLEKEGPNGPCMPMSRGTSSRTIRHRETAGPSRRFSR
jgi:hypothetical protein